MPATHEKIAEFLTSPDWDEGAKSLVMWQFGYHTSSFQIALWNLIKVSDSLNLNKLRHVFPEEVTAFMDWSQGTLATRIREWGLDV